MTAFLFAASPAYSEPTARILAPSRVPPDTPFPVVVYACNDDGSVDDTFGENSTLYLKSPQTAEYDLAFRKGAAYRIVSLGEEADWQFQAGAMSGAITVEASTSLPVISHSNDISTSTETWDGDTVHLVEKSLTVSRDSELIIEGGAIVLVRKNCSLTVYGTLEIAGSEPAPVIFTSDDPASYWGGIEIINGTGEFSYCFFTGGGGDTSREFGHSGSQPVLLAENAVMHLDNCFLIDNPGKAVGGNESVITIESSIIAKCDTGGESINGAVTISLSYIMDIPNEDIAEIDDDNDGFYFNGAPPDSDQHSVVEKSYIIGTRDDGLDHNGAKLTVRNCWIEGCANEGVAASNTNYAEIVNTVVRDCEQGIEAGYGAPAVIVDHCVVTDNDVGLRFGDSYDWGCSGSIKVSNSIFYGNKDNILNYDRKIKGPLENAITVSYSMTNDTDYDNGLYCITGIPVFDDNYYLLDGSPGKGMGIKGNDMGLTEGDAGSELFINELLALNNRLYCDEFGDFDDWVELYNGGSQPIDIAGMYVSDDAGDPLKWQIPQDDSASTTIDPGEFLILWLDGEPEQGTLHIGARLSGAGEQLTIYAADGNTLIDSVSFGEQKENISYGLETDGGRAWRSYQQPTPGLSNSISDHPVVHEYYITCDPSDFTRIYDNYSEDILIPITISHGSRTWDDVKMRIRGETSRKYPKKSLRVEFDASPFSNGRKTLLFNAEYFDTSYMHQYISSLLFRESGIPCFGAEHVRLYLNGEFLGLYLRLDSMDEDFLESEGLDPGGDLYKAAERGACLSVHDDISYHWDKKTNEGTGYGSLTDLIEQLNSVSDEKYYEFTQEHFNYRSIVDVLAINMLIINASTYYHNYYMYLDVNGTGKWTMLPWDLDKTLSSYSWEYPYHASAWSLFRTPDNPLLERAIICDQIFEDIKNRIDELHNTVFNRAFISPVADSLKTLIEASVAEDTTDDITSLDDWEKMIGINLDFIDARYDILKKQFAEMPRTFSLVRPSGSFSDDVTLAWHPSEDPDGGVISYTLKYSSVMNFPDSLTTTISGIADTSYTFEKMPPDGFYYWAVYASDGTYSVEGFDTRSTFTVARAANLPAKITKDMKLTQEESPYLSSGDVIIEKGATVTAGPGTVIKMAENACIIVEGTFNAEGSHDQPVIITSPDAETSWGALCLQNKNGQATLRFVTIENATENRGSSKCNGAVSVIDMTVDLYNIEFKNVNRAISVNGGVTSISNCILHMNNAEEQISVKKTNVAIYNCLIEGSVSDAIDLEEVSGAIIEDCTIESAADDGIDVGDNSTEIEISNVRISGCIDKGISIGQNSKVTLYESLITDSAIGIAVFDGSHADIDRVTLVGNDTAINLYRGDSDKSGGSANVSNSILYGSSAKSYQSDAHSTVQFRYCISDDGELHGEGNLYGIPGFVDPANGDYRLVSSSPCVDAGDPESSPDPDGSRADMGAFYRQRRSLVINEINYNSSPLYDSGDWIELYNPEEYMVDVGGWMIKDANDENFFIFPDRRIGACDYLVISNDLHDFSEIYPEISNITGPIDFGFSGSGDTIRLFDNTGAIVDSLTYSDKDPWPSEPDGNGYTLSLINPFLDNSAAHNWEASIGTGTPGKRNDVYREYSGEGNFLVKPFRMHQNYPNPFNVSTYIPLEILEKCRIRIEVYSILGQKTETLFDGYIEKGKQIITFNGDDHSNGIYIYTVKSGKFTQTGKMTHIK